MATTAPARVARGRVAETDVRSDAPPPGRADPWWARVAVWAGILVVAACCLFVFVKLEPRLLFRNTTPTGGDTVSHVWWPAYLRDHLLPWRIAGWSPAFYGGYPVGQFYFPVPALLVVLFDAILPYNIAFKLVTALGPVTLPAAAFAFGRGLRLPKPAPAAMAVGATAFLFFNGNPGNTADAQAIAGNQHIMGGNLASMLAGEFSFTIALAFALFFLGTFATTLRTDKRAWLPAVLFAATVTSHFIVAFFAVVGAVIIWLASRPIRSFPRAAVVGVVGTLLTAVWVVPLLATFAYTTDTRYEAISRWTDYVFPNYLWGVEGIMPWQWGATVAVGIVLAVAIVKRRSSYFVLLAMTASAGLLFRFWEDIQATPAWNLRFVPFWYLMLFLLMGIAVAEAVRGAGSLAVWCNERRLLGFEPDEPDDPDDVIHVDDGDGREPVPESSPEDGGWLVVRREPRANPRALRAGVVGALVVLLTLGTLVEIDGRENDFLPSWINWNYSGLESPGKASPEFRTLMDTFGELPPGRALWEGNQELNIYGSSLALTILPYVTDQRIASMEGVYYEASATTPYHFLTVSTLMPAKNTSNPIRGLPYGTNAEFSTGVRRLQVLGVRYLAVHSAEAKQSAAADPRLRLVATSPDLDHLPPDAWSIYRVADAPLVERLQYVPVVATRLRTGTAQECSGELSAPGTAFDTGELSEWECLGVPWFEDSSAYDRVLTTDGPKAWQRAPEKRAREMPKDALPPVRVTRVRTTEESVSFRVSRTGVPVLVKTSFFPNWKVDGARGPYRATPNFMVVIPTQRDVTLEYGTTGAEWLGRAGTLLGVGGVVTLAAWPWLRRRREMPVKPEDRAAAAAG